MELQSLNTKFLGRSITHFETIDSTQLEILRKIENKTIKNGEMVVANLQTNGKRNS